MQHQQGSQFYGEGKAPNSIPQYMTTDQHRSTDSNGSQDSIMTQLPLPYHPPLPSDMYGQDYSASVQTEYNKSWTSSTSQVPKFGASQGSSSKKSLNPNSSAYVPSSRARAASNNPDFQNLEHQNKFKDNGQANGFDPLYQEQNQAQIGYPPHPNPNPYRMQDSNSSHFQPQYGITQSPYGNFGNGGATNNYAYNGKGYEAGNLGSQAPNYEMTNNENYHTIYYGPASATSTSQSQGWVEASNSSNFSGALSTHNNSYRPNPAALSFEHRSGMINGSNSQRINERNNAGLKNSGKDINTSLSSNQNFSNKSIAPGRANSAQSSRPASAPKLAGSLPPPKRSSSAATYTSSPDIETPISEGIEDNTDVPTPGPKPHALDIEFSSEPRNNRTPMLRSRRGQSISTLSTDPPRKNSMTNWLDNVPSLVGNALEDITERFRSPPKMMRFNDGGNSMLTPVHEGDPFSDSSLQPANFNNPFAPTTAPGVLRAGSLLRGAGNGMSPQYRNLTRGGTRNPSIQEALDPQNLPFVEYCRNASPSEWGVIRIKNIPYSVNRPEVLAFLGRNARIITEAKHEPVHIVMERVTSKTLNCYVEFVNFQEAINAVNRFETNRTGGRGGRLGPRHVEVELSSQDQLMQELFPKAKNVIWRNGNPNIVPRDPDDPYNSGFQGFVSKEELVMLVKHVEAPQRSPFSKDCPQRPFECLISTLLKFPWYMVDYITIQDRNLIHQATKDLLSLLVERVLNEKNDIHLNPTLLKRVWRAAMLCPGFTPSMKDDIVVICDISAQAAIELGLAPLAAEWRFLWTIGPKPNAPIDVLMYYITLISNATSEQKPQLSLAEQAAQGYQNNSHKLFGDLDKFIQYPKGLASRTLAEVAHSEWTAIEQALRCALTLVLENH